IKVEMCTGFKKAPNVANYNIRFHEGRSVIGTIAGHLSKTGVGGYLATFPVPEVVSGINSFQLAAQAVNPKFRTKVIWINTWFDPAKEADAARALISPNTRRRCARPRPKTSGARSTPSRRRPCSTATGSPRTNTGA